MQRVTLLLLVALLAAGVISPSVPGSSQDRPDAPGKIYFLEGPRLACIQPDGRKRVEFPRELGALVYFQPTTVALAPDSRALAFGLGEWRDHGMHPPSKIYLMDITKARSVESLVDLPDAALHHWAWSRDGRKLALCSWDARNRTRNWVLDVRSKKMEEIKLPLVKTGDGDVQMSVEDWSPDGKSFVAAGNGVHVVRANGTEARRLTPANLLVHGGTCRYSPDGRKILFVATDRGKNEAIYVVEVAGGKPTPLVQFLNFGALRASWSPDGLRIAYSFTFLDAKGERGTESNLNVVGIDGKNSKTVVSVTHKPYEVKLHLIGWR